MLHDRNNRNTTTTTTTTTLSNPYNRAATPAGLLQCTDWNRKGMLREARYKPEKPDDIPIHSQSLILPGLYAIARGMGHLETCQVDDTNEIRITLNHDKDDIKNEVRLI